MNVVVGAQHEDGCAGKERVPACRQLIPFRLSRTFDFAGRLSRPSRLLGDEVDDVIDLSL